MVLLSPLRSHSTEKEDKRQETATKKRKGRKEST